jgi:hypothetical protein
MVTDKAIPVTDRGGPEDCETSRFSRFLNSLRKGGVEVSLTRRPLYNPPKIPGTHFC